MKSLANQIENKVFTQIYNQVRSRMKNPIYTK